MRSSKKLVCLLGLAVGLAGSAWYARACFVRSPQPVQVWLDEVEVDITDQVAVKRYKCTFLNPNNRAVVGGVCYMEVEPGAQIDKMTLTVDGKTTKGEVLEVNKANKVFTDIVRRGGSPALLEFYGSKLIRTRLPRIRPRGTVTVNLQYTTVLKQKGGLVRIQVLNVNPKANLVPLKRASVTVRIRSKSPVRNIYSPTHDIRVVEGKKGDPLTIKWSQEKYLPNKPFVMYYAVSDKKKVGLNMLAHREEGEKGYFMTMISPTLSKGKARITSKDIMPKDVIFCVDTSYSMTENGKIGQAKKALAYCIKHLREGDRFNIVDFSTEARTFKEGGMVEVSKLQIKRALRYVDDIEASGGTAIHEALTTSLKQFGQSKRMKMIMFMTDGLPTIGERDPKRILKDITTLNKQDVRMFVFGAGYNVNARMLDVLALDNRGDSDYILPREDIARKISRFFDKVGSPIMTDLKVSIDGIKASDIYPRQIPDLFKGEQVIVYGRFSASGSKTITLSGNVNGETRRLTFKLDFPKEDEGNEFVPRLWGGQKVSHLLSVLRKNGQNKEMIKEVVSLAKRFGIVTPYTSYLVTRDFVQQTGGGGKKWQRAAGNRLRGKLADLEKASKPSSAREDKRREVDEAQAFSSTRKKLKAGRASGLGYYAQDGKDQRALRDRQMRLMRYIGAKTFYNAGKIWYESSWDASKKLKVTTHKLGSEGYFELASRSRRIARYMALTQVVFQYKGSWYRIVK